jgi:hypothetical protein
MASEKAIKIAAEIVKDFREAGFYPDPNILVDYLHGQRGREVSMESTLAATIRYAINKCAAPSNLDITDNVAEIIDLIR